MKLLFNGYFGGGITDILMFFMIVIFGFSIISMYYLYNWEENERN